MIDFSRTERLIGQKNLNILKNSSVCLFGIGGVGGFTAEALVRSGIGKLTVIDGDTVCASNINRQIIADTKTVGLDKTEVIKERLLSINPELELTVCNLFYLPENADKIDLSKFDYVIDAIDTVTAKLELAKRCKQASVELISCMGTGGKIDPELLTVTDIYKTSGCPLARVMRSELKKRGIEKLKVVFSPEKTVNLSIDTDENEKRTPSSMIFVPATAGLLLAKTVVFDLIKRGKTYENNACI